MNEKVHYKRMQYLLNASKWVDKASNESFSVFLEHAKENIKLAILQEEKDYAKRIEVAEAERSGE
jgi:hypothetical protein